MRKRLWLSPALILVVSPMLMTQAWADSLSTPRGEVILTVSGAIDNTNVGDEAQFDYDMLMSLSPHVVETHTPWTENRGRFEGPLARAVMEAVGARGESLRVKALNDFAADIPLSDFYDHDVILALKRDGKRLEVRNFGPIFVLYPFDTDPQLHNETIRFRSVWQLAHIDVRE